MTSEIIDFSSELSMLSNSQANFLPRKKVAIVGSGSAGVAALWALNKTYHDVYLYEAAGRLGGHANTVQWKTGKYTTAVDTGFMVLNKTAYPNFFNFLKKIGASLDTTDMSYGESRDRGSFEWAGPSLRSLFSQRRNWLSPKMWRMVFDIIRFNQFALDLLLHDEDESRPVNVGNSMMGLIPTEETIGEYISRDGYSDAFRDDYLVPLMAALWNITSDKSLLEYPAATLVRVLWNHHLLALPTTRPRWLTLTDGFKSYIDTVMKGFPPNHLFLYTSVRHVTNESDGHVRVYLENGKSAVYDHVILATHGEQALSLLGNTATPQERSILSYFRTSQNEAVLHSDLSFMPKRRRAWAASNYMTLSHPSTGGGIDRASLTFNMNKLQHIPRNTFGDVLVTLNPIYKPRPEKTQGWYYYSHPCFNSTTVRGQKLLPLIQNQRGISYAGSWTKTGLYEDGFSSGLSVARDHLEARLPFELKDSSYSRGKKPSLGLFDLILRLFIILVQVFIVQSFERLFERKPRIVRPVNGVRFDMNGKANGKMVSKVNGKAM